MLNLLAIVEQRPGTTSPLVDTVGSRFSTSSFAVSIASTFQQRNGRLLLSEANATLFMPNFLNFCSSFDILHIRQADRGSCTIRLPSLSRFGTLLRGAVQNENDLSVRTLTRFIAQGTILFVGIFLGTSELSQDPTLPSIVHPHLPTLLL